MNLVLPSTTSPSGSSAGYPDVLTSLLTSVIGSLPFSQSTIAALEEQVPWAIRQLNLIVVGAIILSSLRRVLVALRIARCLGISALGRSRGTFGKPPRNARPIARLRGSHRQTFQVRANFLEVVTG